MQSSLWKLGALLGVIGGGFGVLLQAQKGMQSAAAPAEEFNDVAAIEELGELRDETRDALASPSEDVTSRIALADTYGAKPTPQAAKLPAQAEPNLPAQEEPTPTPAASVSSTTPSSGAPGEDANPFSAFSFDSPADTQSASASQAASNRQPGEESANPFSALIDAVNEVATSDGAAPAAALDGETPAVDAADAHLAAADAFNPFAASDDSGAKPAAQPKTADQLEAPEQTSPAGPETTAASDAFPVDDRSSDDASQASAQDDRVPGRHEPPGLRPLPDDAPGPMLMAPPGADAPALHAQQQAHAQPHEPELHTEQAELAVYEVTSSDDPPQSQPAAEIVQVGAEERPQDATQPNPFLVFPGDDPPTRPAPRPPHTVPSRAAPAAASVEPQGSSGRAWVGDGSADTAPAGGEEPSNSSAAPFEMTIMPRGSEAPQAIPTKNAAPPPLPGSETVNPFASVPERLDRQAAASQPKATAADLPPAKASAPAQPRPADAGLSFSRGSIQPAGGELPASKGGGGFTQADFVGVGTISPETPSTPQQAQLTIEKQAPGDAVLGQDLVYSILVTNVGQSPARNVVVQDLVPKGSDLKGTDPQAQMTPDKTLIWHLGTMDPGAQRKIRIKVVPTQAGQIGSVATVSFEAAVASRTVIIAPELKLSLSGPGEVRVGEKAPLKFTLTNSGTADASGVFVRSIIPAGFEHPAARQENGVTDIEYEVGVLPRGQTKEVELTLRAIAPGDFQNHAILTADGNVSVESHQAVHVIASRLQIRREGPANRFVQSEARFTNAISNESSEPLRHITVTESLPAGMAFVQASDGGQFDAQQRTITWLLDALEPGGVRRLSTLVLPQQEGRLASTVKARDERGETAQASSSLTVAGFSSLTVDVAHPGRPVPVGEEVALRLKVRNGGTAAANAVATRVQLPRQLRFVSARGPVRYAQQGEWIAFEPINRIEVDGEQTFDIVLAAAEATQDARIVVQLSSDELSKPLSEDESVVIYAADQ